MTRQAPVAGANTAPSSSVAPAVSMPAHTISSVPVQTTAGMFRWLIGAGGSSTVDPGGMSVNTAASTSGRSATGGSVTRGSVTVVSVTGASVTGGTMSRS